MTIEIEGFRQILNVWDMYAERSAVDGHVTIRTIDEDERVVTVPADTPHETINIMLQHGAKMFKRGQIQGAEFARQRIKAAIFGE